MATVDSTRAPSAVEEHVHATRLAQGAKGAQLAQGAQIAQQGGAGAVGLLAVKQPNGMIDWPATRANLQRLTSAVLSVSSHPLDTTHDVTRAVAVSPLRTFQDRPALDHALAERHEAFRNRPFACAGCRQTKPYSTRVASFGPTGTLYREECEACFATRCNGHVGPR